MKIYTRTGDTGTTGLTDGTRILKTDPRIEAYGSIDELNAVVGWVCATPLSEFMHAELRQIQHELFVVGALLATPHGPMESKMPQLAADAVTRIEKQIDVWSESLPPLTQFILPAGSESAARLHIARTVCRRAERAMYALGAATDLPDIILQFLNRLSDYFFVLARAANKEAGKTELMWKKN